MFAVILSASLLGLPPGPGQSRQYKKCFTTAFENGVQGLAIDPNGDFSAAVTNYSTLYFFRGGIAPTGFMTRQYDYVECLAPHPTEKIMAAAWGKVRLLDVLTRKEIAELKTKGKAEFVAWGKEGTQVISVDDKHAVQVWDVATKKAVVTWSLPLDKKTSFAFADYADASRLLAVATRDGDVRVFEIDSGRQVGTVMNHSTDEEIRITGMDFHPDGKRLATCSHAWIKVWDTADSQAKARFSTKPGQLVTGIRFYAKGTRMAMVSASDSGYGFMFLDAATGKLISWGDITEYDAVEHWDMAYPDADDPEIICEADQTLYLCRYNAIIGKSPGVQIIR